MSTITFDTQELARELRTAGMPQEQAEAVVRAITKAQTELVTKADLALLETKLDGKFTLLQWMLGILLAGVLSLVLKAFF